MPYAPGIQYHGDQNIAQGRENLISAIMTLVGGLTQQAGQAKQLRTTLSDVDPQNKDRYAKMGLNELKGTVSAMELQSKQQAAQLLAQEAKSRIAAAQNTATGQGQLGQFFQAWQKGMQPGTASAPVPGVGSVGVPAPGQSPLNSMLAAASQFPQAAQVAGISRDLPALLRAQTAGTATQQAVMPFSSGTGKNKLSGGIETKTGRVILDAETERNLAQAKHIDPAKISATAAPELPEGGSLHQATDDAKKPIANLFEIRDAKGKAIKWWSNPHAGGGRTSTDQFIDQFTGAGGGAPGEAGGFAPAGSGNAQYVVGNYYKQNNQLYKWDGQQMQPVGGPQ